MTYSQQTRNNITCEQRKRDIIRIPSGHWIRFDRLFCVSSIEMEQKMSDAFYHFRKWNGMLFTAYPSSISNHLKRFTSLGSISFCFNYSLQFVAFCNEFFFSLDNFSPFFVVLKSGTQVKSHWMNRNCISEQYTMQRNGVISFTLHFLL